MPYMSSSWTKAETKGKGEILGGSGLGEPRCWSRIQNRLHRRAGRGAQDMGIKAEWQGTGLEGFSPLSCSRSDPGFVGEDPTEGGTGQGQVGPARREMGARRHRLRQQPRATGFPDAPG